TSSRSLPTKFAAGLTARAFLTTDWRPSPPEAFLPITCGNQGPFHAGLGTHNLGWDPRCSGPGTCQRFRGTTESIPGTRHALVGPDRPCRFDLKKMAEKR